MPANPGLLVYGTGRIIERSEKACIRNTDKTAVFFFLNPLFSIQSFPSRDTALNYFFSCRPWENDYRAARKVLALAATLKAVFLIACFYGTYPAIKRARPTDSPCS